MISWIWIPVSLLVGACVGVLMIGLVAADREKYGKWGDDD